MSMAAYSLLAAIVIRLIMALTPWLGLDKRDIRSFALGGTELQEAKELMGVLDSRLILYSWPLFAIVTIATRAGELKKAFTGPSVPLFVLGLIVLWIVFFCLPTRALRGTLPPVVVLVVVSILDALLFFVVMDRIIPLMTVDAP